jgi:pilus assembly protein CpaB
VLVAGKPEGDSNVDERSKLILQNVRVLATGKSIEQQDEKPVEVPTVTLLVSPEEAEKLTLATRQEPVRLALRNFRDEEGRAHVGGDHHRALRERGAAGREDQHGSGPASGAGAGVQRGSVPGRAIHAPDGAQLAL